MQSAFTCRPADIRRASLACVTLPDGHRVTLSEYLRSWRLLRTMPADALVKGWDDWPATVADILRAIGVGVNDRINIRGGVTLGRAMTEARIRRNLVRTVKCSCRWCGEPMAEYRPREFRFCGTDCRRSYWN